MSEEDDPCELEDRVATDDIIRDKSVQDIPSVQQTGDDDEIVQWYGEEASQCCERGCNKSIPKTTALERRYTSFWR